MNAQVDMAFPVEPIEMKFGFPLDAIRVYVFCHTNLHNN